MEKYRVDYTRVEDRSMEQWMMILEAIKYYLETTQFPELETVIAILGIVETDEYKKEKRELEELFYAGKGSVIPCLRND